MFGQPDDSRGSAKETRDIGDKYSGFKRKLSKYKVKARKNAKVLDDRRSADAHALALRVSTQYTQTLKIRNFSGINRNYLARRYPSPSKIQISWNFVQN